MSNSQHSIDAFLSYRSADERLIKEVAAWLEDEAGFRVWLDEWSLTPGDPWQEGIEQALEASKCFVVFLGPEGIGAWQNEEIRAALAKRVELGGLRVVPVLLPRARRPKRESLLPSFLRRLMWVRLKENWKKDTMALHRLACGIRGIPPGRPEGKTFDICPYRGLEAFRPQDERFFFGREALVERLLDHLDEQRFLVLSGPSGAGKSSLIQAGLIAKLKNEKTLVETLTPRTRPLEELAFALRRSFPAGQTPPSEDLMERLGTSPEALHLIAREVADAVGARRVILVIDQFEELFTQSLDDKNRQDFVAWLLRAVETPGPVTVILVVRSDFLGHCTFEPDLRTFVNDHLEQVGSMSRWELKSALVNPALLVGLNFEDGLVEQILNDVEGAPGNLPLLQHALLELYERRCGMQLTWRAYQDIGGIEGALTQRAESEFSTLGAKERKTLRKMFVLCLAEAGEGTEHTRRRATREELLAVGEDPQISESLLTQWTEARLLTSHSDEIRHLQWVDVAHEALIRKWERLATWMAEDREKSRLVRVLRQWAREWDKQDRHKDYLIHGTKLIQAEGLVAEHGKDLAELEKSFVAAARLRALRINSLVTIGLLFVLAAAGYFVVDSNRSKNAALAQLSRNYWEKSRVARDQEKFLSSAHLISEAIALQPSGDLRENQRIDLAGFQPHFALKEIIAHRSPIVGARFGAEGGRILTWDEQNIAHFWDLSTGNLVGSSFKDFRKAVFSDDGSRLLIWSDGGSLGLWNGLDGTNIASMILDHEISGLSFDPEQRVFLSWGAGKMSLWDAISGKQVGSSFAYEGSVLAAAFGEGDNLYLLSREKRSRSLCSFTLDLVSGEVSGDLGRGVQPEWEKWQVNKCLFFGSRLDNFAFKAKVGRALWQKCSRDSSGEHCSASLLDVPNKKIIPFDIENRVSNAIFSGDGQQLLAWTNKATLQLLYSDDGSENGPPLSHQGYVLGAVLSDDGSRALTWDSGNRAQVWNPVTGDALGPVLEYQGEVLAAIIDRGGYRILTRDADTLKARVWYASTRDHFSPSVEIEGDWLVFGAQFNKNEDRILTRDHSGAQIWDASSGEKIGHKFEHERLDEAYWCAGEERLLTRSWNYSAKLWNVKSGESVSRAFEDQGAVYGSVVSQDGYQIVVWNREGTARLWDAASGKQIGPTIQHIGGIQGALYTGREGRLLTLGLDGTAKLWAHETGQQIGQAFRHKEEGDWQLAGAELLDSGRQLLTWGNEKTKLWDIATGGQIGSTMAYQDGIWDVFIAGNIRHVVTSSMGHGMTEYDSREVASNAGGVIRFWDLATGQQVGPSIEHDQATLNREEGLLMTWRNDGTLRFWDVMTGQQIGRTLEGQSRVWGLLPSNNPYRVATWGVDKVVRLWDLPTGGQLGPDLKHDGTVWGASFNTEETQILSWSRESKIRLWDIGADLDFPRSSLRIQMSAVTGTEYSALNGDITNLAPDQWRQARAKWDRLGRSHYKTCRYPRHNLWRHFNPREAENVRSLDE